MKEILLLAANGTKEEKISLFEMRLALSLRTFHIIMPVVVTSRVIGQLPVAVSCVIVSKKMRLCDTTTRPCSAPSVRYD